MKSSSTKADAGTAPSKPVAPPTAAGSSAPATAPPPGSNPGAGSGTGSGASADAKLDWHRMLRWLAEDGVIDAEQVQRTEGRFAAAKSALHPLVRLGNAGLVRTATGKPLDIEGLTEWLAGRLKLPYVRIDPLKVDVGRIADVMSANYAEARRCLPIQVGLTDVTIATAEPNDTGWVPQIESHTRKRVKLVLANPQEIARFTTEFFTLARSVKAATKSGEVSQQASFEQLVELGRSNRQLDANDQGIVQVVDWLWQYAFDQRASDIHLEPRREMGVIRFRIDGVLHTVYQLPPSVMGAMTSRIKLLGRMDVVEKRRPLDGRIKTRNPAGEEVEMRLSTLPTAFGEKMVMRIFDPDTAVKDLAQLGFSGHDAERWNRLTSRPHGIILVTGPTGSGKTSTLYSTLKRLATEEVNVCTVEDPIEMIEPAFNQTQVQSALDFNFAEGLRALMRQDPDIIMVGEIRDLETAEMAIQASLTGHLVFSTLHTNDSASAITRMVDLGVPNYLIDATVIGVLAQRLVRTLCPTCKQPDPDVTRDTLNETLKPWRLNGGVKPYKPVGCLDCRNTGYRGRAGLYELLLMSDTVRKHLHPVTDMTALRRQAVQEGLRPLRLAGAMKVAEGLTTMEEVLRSTPTWET
ncbi:MAG: type II/IV secretion system protein [Mitsuaria chitosanitabida]|uniref:GspE/PulE family protein n=2 Tax=Roseateles chitosanitabidus TaxID=65048 RepID=UPI001B00F513|nr:type II/IV secretion system protein [Roseateles chitosanitabidus]